MLSKQPVSGRWDSAVPPSARPLTNIFRETLSINVQLMGKLYFMDMGFCLSSAYTGGIVAPNVVKYQENQVLCCRYLKGSSGLQI